MSVRYEGVYSSVKNFGVSYPMGYRKFYWFVWSIPLRPEFVIAQALDSVFNPIRKPIMLEKRVFNASSNLEHKIKRKPDFDINLLDFKEYLGADFFNLLEQEKNNAAERESNRWIDFEESPKDTKITSSPKAKPQRSDRKVASFEDGNGEIAVTDENFLAMLFQEQHSVDESISVIEQKAIEVDSDLRSNFAVALIDFRKGNRKKSMQGFENILKVRDGIHPAHKHMFTDFAVGLRKCNLLSLAVECATRALELSADDTNAYFNVARLYFELGKKQDALKYLDAALKIDPKFEEAHKLVQVINKKLDNNMSFMNF